MSQPASMDPRADGSERVVCWNPATGQRFASLPVHSPAAIDAMVSAAQAAQREWGALPVRQRARTFKAIHSLFVERMPQIARLCAEEMGKPLTTALWAELIQVADWLRWYPRKAPGALATEYRKPHMLVHRAVSIAYHPKGVLGVIGPWNYPVAIPAGDIIPGLLAGNAILFKPSETTPLAALALRDVFVDAGLPADLFQVVLGYGEAGAHLIEAGVDMVIFTGSGRTGQKVGVAAAGKMIPSILELGGKAPCIVLPGANVRRSARAIVWGGFFNSGHTCVASDRVYVIGPDLHDRMVAALKLEIDALSLGDPLDPNTDVGPIAFEHQAHLAQELIDDAVARGATVLCGGTRAPKPGCFFQPTLLTGCDHSMRIMNEESFAPILPVQKVDSAEEALELANDSDVGLAGYVFGPTGKARALASRMEVGMVNINNTLDHFAPPEVPWGGVKGSGLGRSHGTQAMRDTCNMHVVMWPDLPSLPKELWWFPYSKGVQNLAWRLGRFLTAWSPWTAPLWLLRSPPPMASMEAAMPRLPQGSEREKSPNP